MHSVGDGTLNCTPTWGAVGEGAVWFEGYRLGETVRVPAYDDISEALRRRQLIAIRRFLRKISVRRGR